MAEFRTFLIADPDPGIEARPEADIVLRVLAPFAVQGAQILTLAAEQGADRTSIRLEASGVGPDVAGLLVERLRAMPSVTTVGLGWRAGT